MTDLNKLFNLNEWKSYALAQLITETNKRHPADRHHFAAHLEGKLEDPNHKACVPELEDLCASVMQNFTSDEVQILIDEIIPNEEEMKLLTFMQALSALLGPATKRT